MTSALGRSIARRIALTGPISVADFMAEALGHPRLGYYRTAHPLGAAGDFITAPEISQMFGELVGVWLTERWQAMGSPSPCLLVELGPGRGMLIGDALRATRSVPGFHAALRLHLIEINESLRDLQRAILATHGTLAPSAWHERLDDVPEGPLLLVANEFLDALPVRQFQRTPAGWSERMVGLAEDGESLRFALAPGVSPFHTLLPADASPGATAELSPAATGLASAVGERVATHGGWALFIDYGGDTSRLGLSLQAVRAHRGTDVLDRPGETDLSAHVDFSAIAAAATAAGARVFGPTGQGDFLRRLGIEQRAEALKMRATPSQALAIDASRDRLITKEQMGTLFRVLALGDTTSTSPAGFSDPFPDTP